MIQQAASKPLGNGHKEAADGEGVAINQRKAKIEDLERKVLLMVRDGRMRAMLEAVVEIAYGDCCAFNAPCRTKLQTLFQMRPRRGRGLPYTDEEVAKAEAMFREGKPTVDVALELGRTRNAIRLAVQHGKIRVPNPEQRKRPRTPDAEIQRAVRMHEEGKTWKQAAEAIGISRTTVLRRIGHRR